MACSSTSYFPIKNIILLGVLHSPKMLYKFFTKILIYPYQRSSIRHWCEKVCSGLTDDDVGEFAINKQFWSLRMVNIMAFVVWMICTRFGHLAIVDNELLFYICSFAAVFQRFLLVYWFADTVLFLHHSERNVLDPCPRSPSSRIWIDLRELMRSPSWSVSSTNNLKLGGVSSTIALWSKI